MHKNMNEKFKIYVKDKAIQESVLDSNPIPDAESLKIPKVDGYLNDIFDTLGKSYGRESDGTLSKTQARINNVMGPLGKLWLNLEKIRTDDSTEELDLLTAWNWLSNLSRCSDRLIWVWLMLAAWAY